MVVFLPNGRANQVHERIPCRFGLSWSAWKSQRMRNVCANAQYVFPTVIFGCLRAINAQNKPTHILNMYYYVLPLTHRFHHHISVECASNVLCVCVVCRVIIVACAFVYSFQSRAMSMKLATFSLSSSRCSGCLGRFRVLNSLFRNRLNSLAKRTTQTARSDQTTIGWKGPSNCWLAVGEFERTNNLQQHSLWCESLRNYCLE